LPAELICPHTVTRPTDGQFDQWHL